MKTNLEKKLCPNSKLTRERASMKVNQRVRTSSHNLMSLSKSLVLEIHPWLSVNVLMKRKNSKKLHDDRSQRPNRHKRRSFKIKKSMKIRFKSSNKKSKP